MKQYRWGFLTLLYLFLVLPVMNYVYKVTSKYILACTFILTSFLLTIESKSINVSYPSFHNSLTTPDTLPHPNRNKSVQKLREMLKTDSAQRSPIKNSDINKSPDTSLSLQRRDTFDLKVSRDSLDAPMDYSADDSMVLDVPSKKIILYGKQTKLHYKGNDLSAPMIQLDQETGIVGAYLKRDSTGKVIAFPTFKQDDLTTVSDSIRFNTRTGKGITKSSYTQQGEIFVYGEDIKKISNDVFYIKRARFTTCDYDTPHFAFVSNRMKFINNKWAYSGPVHPEFEGVPLPIYFPFGIYPLTQGRHSGFLAPQFTTNQQKGLGLEGIGYYKILGPYWDIILRSNIYSYGGYSMNINPRYMKRYHYSGNLNLEIQHFNLNFKGDPDFQTNRSYFFTWTHTQDSKARPGTNFSANVHAGSSSFNRSVPNDPVRNFNNQLQSSIAYSKTWKNKNLTIVANHSQNTQSKLVDIHLPDVGFNINTIYPFRSKEEVGTLKWYENIGIAYNGNASSRFSFYDTMPQIFKHISDTLLVGAHHSLPITLSLPQIGSFQISPSISYDETWYQRKTIRTWDTVQHKLITSEKKGFYTARQMSFGLGASTRIIGMYSARHKDAKIQNIRHEIRPTFGIAYMPNMNKRNYYEVQTDTLNNKQVYSVFDNNVYGAYGNTRFGGISFGIDNNLQMKVRNKKDTGENAVKKITLIDGLSMNGGYNFLLDSFQLSTLSLSLRSTLFDKLNLTAFANIDPYDVDRFGRRLKDLLWKRKPLSFGRFLSGNLALSTSFQGGNKGTGTKKVLSRVQNSQYGYSNDEYQNELGNIRNNPGQFADFNIPWSVNFQYALNLGRSFKDSVIGFKNSIEHSAVFGGSINLTPKWQIQLNGSYNFTAKQLGYIPITLSREMHCWQMSISISPVGNKFYSIYISPKSGLLRDLKINRTRSFSTY